MIINKFNALLESNPNRIILETADHLWSLSDINKILNQMAHQIDLQFQSEEVVPVSMVSDLNLIASIMAIFKTGRIYYPIAADAPIAHVNKLLASISGTKIFTDKEINISPNKTCLFHYNLNQEATYSSKPQNKFAYIISTSGSTGSPKGTLVSHKNLNWFLSTIESLFPLKRGNKFLLTTPCNFDVSIHELLSFLYGEGQLYSLPNQSSLRKLQMTPKVIEDHGITHIALSPSSASFILNHVVKNQKPIMKLKYCLLAGETLSPHLARLLQERLPNCCISNLYGPTETTVYATYYTLPRPFTMDHVPIGIPLPGVDIRFESNNGPSEILIGGQGVASGYYRNELETKNRFIGDKLVFYRSGDLGSLDPSNQILFHGRNDEQIKINGVRVEPAEIEFELHQHLKKAYAITTEFKIIYFKNKLICFVVSTSEYELIPLIEEFSSNHLPSYLRPQLIIPIKELPLTPSRKIDLLTLKRVAASKMTSDAIAPINHSINLVDINKDKCRNAIIEHLSDVSGRDMKSLKGNDLLLLTSGIDSLNTLRFLMAIEHQFSIKLNDDALLHHNTLDKMTDYIHLTLFKTVSSDLIQDSQIESSELPRLKAIEDNYLANSFLITNFKGVAIPTSYIQKCYYYDNFDSIITFKINISPSTSIDHIRKVITHMVRSNFVLHSNLELDQEELFFVQHSLSEEFNYNILEMNNFSDQESSHVQFLLSKKWRLKNIKYFFIYDSAKKELSAFFSHYIFDQSSIEVFKKQFFTNLESLELKSFNDYNDFITLIRENSPKFQMNNLLLTGFDKIPKAHLRDSSNTLPGIEYICFTKETLNSQFGSGVEIFNINQHINLQINFVILSALAAANRWSAIGGSTIENIRTLGGRDFSKTLGDLHSTIPLLYLIEDTFQDFSNRYSSSYCDYQKGINFYQNLYKNYPNIPEDEKKFEFYLEDNLKLSLNYLGEIRPDGLDMKIKNILNSRNKLKTFSTTKLYASIFTSGNKIYLVPMNPYVAMDFTLHGNLKPEIKRKEVEL